MPAKIEYFHVSLSSIIRFYIKNALNQHDCDIVGIDTTKDVVMFKRFDYKEKEKG